MAMRTNAMIMLVLATVSVGFGAASAQAAAPVDATWEGASGQNWGNGTWHKTKDGTPSGTPTKAGDSARFTDSAATASVVIQDTRRTVGTLEFSGSSGWSITTETNDAALVLAGTTVAPIVTVHSGLYPTSINGRFQGTQGFTLNGGGTLKLSATAELPNPAKDTQGNFKYDQTPFAPRVSGAISVADSTTLVLGGVALDTSAATALVTVASRSKFAGSGTVYGTLTLNGTVSPGEGTGTGTLTTGHEDWNSTGEYDVNINGVAPTAADYLYMSGVAVASGFKVRADGAMLTGFDKTKSYGWKIATSTSGDFNVASLNMDLTTVNFPTFGGNFSLVQQAGVGSTKDLYLSYSAVPEATTMLLGAVAVMPILLQRRRQRGAGSQA